MTTTSLESAAMESVKIPTAEKPSPNTSALKAASSGAASQSFQKQQNHSKVLDRLGNSEPTAKTSVGVSSAERKPKQIDYDVNCPYCGRVNPYDYTSCDPVLPRICQGDQE